MMFRSTSEIKSGSRLPYFVIFALLFSQNAIAFNDCKHDSKSDSDISPTAHNQTPSIAQDKSIEHCHLNKNKHNADTQAANKSTYSASCCDKPCAHCQLVSIYIDNGFKQSDYNFQRPAGKEISVYPDLKYVSHKTEPIIPPPIS